jgi:hypothetical protein
MVAIDAVDDLVNRGAATMQGIRKTVSLLVTKVDRVFFVGMTAAGGGDA